MLRFILFLLVFLFIGLSFRALRGETSPRLSRLTNTSEQSLNLNPMLSDNGLVVAFESTEDLESHGPNSSFRLFQANLETNFFEGIGETRAVSPGLSSDGKQIAFASTEDLLGENSDRNSEIYLFDGSQLKQITHTSPASEFSRLSDGNFEPSISADGGRIAYRSNRESSDSSTMEVCLFDRTSTKSTQLTHGGALHARLSGDGKWIYFVPAESQGTDLLLVDVENGKTTIAAEAVSSLSLTSGRAVSHDGSRMVYSASTGDNQTQVFLFDYRARESRQLTHLGTRSSDVELNPTISGDGKRVAFSTRRKVKNSSDGSVELYVLDLPTGEIQQVTDAPTSATGAVVSSLNLDGSLVAFSFPRVLSGAVNDPSFSNNSEIYVASLDSRPEFGHATISNAAKESNVLAPESLGVIKGTQLAFKAEQAKLIEGLFPLSIQGISVQIEGKLARLVYASPDQIIFVVPSNLSDGPTEFIVTNFEGFPSRGQATISRSAPGVFASDNHAIALDAETFLTAPFDPSEGNKRLAIFATGVRNAAQVEVALNGERIPAETVLPSSFPGLDEIHVLLPTQLRGAGITQVAVNADHVESNSVAMTIGGSSLRDIMINEILSDPPDGLEGDANRDGVRDSSSDEFVELVNATTRDLDLSDYQIQTRAISSTVDTLRHRFPVGTILRAGAALVVFGGGTVNSSNPAFGGAQVVRTSTSGLSLVNSGGVVTLRDQSGTIVTSVTYGSTTSLPGDANQSLTRAPDVIGSFVLHRIAEGSNNKPFSPGTRVDGKGFALFPGPDPFPTPTPTPNPTPTPVPTPVPTPTPAPTPTPTPIPTPTLTPTPTPIPTPTPPPSPTPSPTPSPLPPLVISELRTRGPRGASDEFVEIYNNSDSVVNAGGLKIRGSSSSGTITTRLTINPNTFIPARGHFLATNSAGYSGLVTGDQSFTSGFANDGGVAITLADDTVIDQVGFSPGSAFREGMHLAPLPSDANQSYERKPGGLSASTQDTQDNFQDFHLLTPSNPQNIQGNTPGPIPTPSPSVSPTPSLSPSPSPTPTPSPSSSPSPTPTPLPSPSISPTPSPSPSPSPTPSPSPVGSSNVVISQVFGGGGNASAPFRNDFIEIFNAGDIAVNLSGWSVQYASATATTWSVTNLTTVLAPGQYYLIQEAGGAAGSILPTADASGTIALAATAGKVALVKNATALSGACPVSTNVADLIGYGTSANCFEGSGPAPTPSNTNAVTRDSLGCNDTGNNATDFSVATPSPRNTSSSIHSCLPPSAPSLNAINLCFDLCTLSFVLRSHANCGFKLSVSARIANKEQSFKVQNTKLFME